MDTTYPGIDDGNFKGALWAFKQWPTLKMQVRYGILIVLLNVLVGGIEAFSGYVQHAVLLTQTATIYRTTQLIP